MKSEAFKRAVEAKDHAGMVAAVAPDIVFHSPVTFKPFEGREAVAQLFSALLQTFEDFTYTDALAAGDVEVLIFQTRVGDRQVEGMDLLRFGPDGLIADFTVMVRPLSGTIALAEAVGARLAAVAAESSS